MTPIITDSRSDSDESALAAQPTTALSRTTIEGSPPLVESLCASTTFLQTELDGQTHPTYSRVDNPTVAALETVLGRLESAPPAFQAPLPKIENFSC